jgi:carbamoyl-phosphate synthase large subunit
MSARVPVLVTGVGACGVGEGIAKALALTRDHYRVVVCNADVGGSQLFEAESGWLVPRASDDGYLEAIERICRAEQVRFIIPGSEAELPVLASASAAFAQYGCEVLANPSTVLEIGADKWATFHFLSEHGFGTPMTVDDFEAPGLAMLGFPLIVKPRSGHGSKHVFRVGSAAELSLIRDYFRFYKIQPVIQEEVGDADAEYTASVLMTPKAEVIGAIAMRRELIGGATKTVEVRPFPAVVDEVKRIGLALGATGPINIQCRVVHGIVKTFEINPRFSGSAPFRALVGFNEPHIVIQNRLTGFVPEGFDIRHGVFGVRSFAETVVDGEQLARVRSTLP